MGERLQTYYEKVGKLLSDLLSDPFSEKLKMAFATKFLNRYRACAYERAPKQGVMTKGKVGTVGSWNIGRAFHKLELIKAAEKSIVMSGCYFGGEIFDQALDLIKKQLISKPDLDVKLIGSEYMLTPSNRVKIAKLEADYPHQFLMQITPEVQYYKSPVSDRSSYRTNHMKLLVIDYGKYFETGGSGVVDRWQLSGADPMQTEGGARPMEPLAFRDMDYLFQDQEEYGVGYSLYLELLSLFPVWSAKNIKERIAHSFDARFNHVQPPSKKNLASIPWDFSPSDGVTFYSSGPDQKENQLYVDLLKDVREAQSTIVIQHMYFHPPKELLASLIEASNRGIDILIYTNRDGVDMPFTHSLYAELSRASWKSLFEGEAKSNVYIFEFNVANTTYHKKLILIDSQVTYLGSSNMGEKSFGMHDQEVDLRIVSSTMGANVLEKSIQEDQRLCFKYVPPEEARHQQINEVALAEVQSFLFKPWL